MQEEAQLSLGGNGSGKSTILRIAAGLARPTSGRISRPTSIGYVPERQPATVRMSGGEYIASMGRIRGLRQSEIDSSSAELFERLGLRPGPDASISSLSKGNRQKIFLSQALLAPVDLLLLDEPFAGLDVYGTRGLVEILEERMDAGATVLMSTHESQIVPGSFRVLRLGDGVFVDPAAEDLVGCRVAVGVRVVLSPRLKLVTHKFCPSSTESAQRPSTHPEGPSHCSSTCKLGNLFLLRPSHRVGVSSQSSARRPHPKAFGGS